MALPSSGPLAMSQVSVELGLAATTQLDLGDSRVRGLANKPSGPISFLDLYGKSSRVWHTTNLTVGSSRYKGYADSTGGNGGPYGSVANAVTPWGTFQSFIWASNGASALVRVSGLSVYGTASPLMSAKFTYNGVTYLIEASDFRNGQWTQFDQSDEAIMAALTAMGNGGTYTVSISPR